MKVFILGKGFIAEHLLYSKIEGRLDFSSKQISYIINQYKPDVLINCIGKTGKPNIDQCELPSHKEETALLNTALPIMLAEACSKHSIHLIHIGSGCVFFGESPHTIPYEWSSTGKSKDYESHKIDTGWKETDHANPQSYYSCSKYAADLAIGSLPNTTILRIRMPVSDKDTTRNLINKLKDYSQVLDIPNSMTFMTDFVRCVEWVIKEARTGIYHVTNPGTLSPAGIMREYQKYVLRHQFTAITEAQLDQLTLAKRSNCILNTDKLERAGFRMTPAREALQQCMKKYMEQHV